MSATSKANKRKAEKASGPATQTLSLAVPRAEKHEIKPRTCQHCGKTESRTSLGLRSHYDICIGRQKKGVWEK